MYRLIKDFLHDWKYESEATLKLISFLDDASFNKQVHPKIRTIRNLAWHIASTPVEMLNLAGLNLTGLDHKAGAPEKPHEITKAYEIASQQVVQHVPEWSDEELLEKVNMYGEDWTKGTVLNILIKHQAHHRGELLILMRLNELPVIGVYGPTNEEWAQYGLEAHV